MELKIHTAQLPLKLLTKKREKMINATITTYSGDKKVIPFQNREAVQTFIKELPKRLSKNTSVFFECDIFSISGTIRGEK